MVPSRAPFTEGRYRSPVNTPSPLVSLLVPVATKDWLGPVATGVAALIAITGVIISTVIQRRTGRESVKQAERSADAADRASKASEKSADSSQVSAAAADRSSMAAERSVELNEQIAGEVAQRAVADGLAKRYQDAAAQLGHDKAPVRLAGVYAMARLADDWPEQRQTCVDVLVAFLRLPWIEREPDSTTTEGSLAAINWRGDLEVRRTVLRLFGEHLIESHPSSWSDYQLDLRNCELPSFIWTAPVFRAPLLFSGATFNEVTRIDKPTFIKASHFEGVVVNGSVRIENATCQGELSFAECEINGGLIIGMDEVADQGSVTFDEMVINGSFQLQVRPTKMQQGTIHLNQVKVNGHGDVAGLNWIPLAHVDPATLKVPVYFPTVNITDSGGSSFQIRSVKDEEEFKAWPGYGKWFERRP